MSNEMQVTGLDTLDPFDIVLDLLLKGKEAIDNAAERMNKASETLETFTRMAGGQRHDAEVSIASAQDENNLIEAKQHIEQEIEEAKTRQYEAAEKGNNSEVKHQQQLIDQLQYILKHTDEIQARKNSILTADQQSAAENANTAANLREQMASLQEQGKWFDAEDARRKEENSQREQILAAKTQGKLITIDEAESEGKITHKQAEQQRQSLADEELKLKFDQAQDALQLKGTDTAETLNSARSILNAANSNVEKTKDSIAKAHDEFVYGNTEATSIAAGQREDRLKQQLADQQKLADEAKVLFDQFDNASYAIDRQSKFQKELQDLSTQNQEKAEIHAIAIAAKKDRLEKPQIRENINRLSNPEVTTQADDPYNDTKVRSGRVAPDKRTDTALGESAEQYAKDPGLFREQSAAIKAAAQALSKVMSRDAEKSALDELLKTIYGHVERMNQEQKIQAEKIRALSERLRNNS